MSSRSFFATSQNRFRVLPANGFEANHVCLAESTARQYLGGCRAHDFLSECAIIILHLAGFLGIFSTNRFCRFCASSDYVDMRRPDPEC